MWNTKNQSLPNQPPIQKQVTNIAVSSVPQYPAVQTVQINEGWWSRNHKNKPQSNSVGSASIIFMSGGMNMAWKLGFTVSANQAFVVTDHIILSWFIGAIIGVVVGACACNYVPKKILICFASILVTIGGILQVSDPNWYDGILASRYINGVAVGLVFPVTFVLIGEEVVKEMRGMNAASTDTMCFSSGIFTEIIFNISWTTIKDSNFHSLQMSGILNIIYGVIAFIIASLLIIESPVFYLARGEEQMAIDALRRLQRPFTITYETYEQLEEHKRYLAKDKERTFLQNAVYGIPALIKVSIYRSFMALGCSFFINNAFEFSSTISSQLQVFPYILYGLARFLGSLLVSFGLDSKGRKPPIIVGFFVCTILAFTVGAIFDNKVNLIDIDHMNIVKYLLIIFQLFAALSMASSSAYLSEAFPFAVKPYFVAIVFIVEMMVHIIIISCKGIYLAYIFHISDYFLTLGALSLGFIIMALFVMPETKLCSLRECLVKFRKIDNHSV